MPDSESTEPERTGQDWFTLRTLFGCILLLLAVDQFIGRMGQVPDREELGPRLARVDLRSVPLSDDRTGPFRVAGKWELTSDDPRLGGVSGLAMDGDALVAVTDAGAVVRFSRPKGSTVTALIKEVPDGPMSGGYKANRDAEALVRDPRGLGWWVAYENFNELWLYNASFTLPLRSFSLGEVARTWNVGIEGAAFDRDDLLLFNELGGTYLRLGKHPPVVERIADAPGRLSEVAALRPGVLVAIERSPTPLGFTNALVLLKRTAAGYRLAGRYDLPAGPLENFEGLAVDRTAAGTRLWLISDDSFEQPFRTVLLALDLAAGWPPVD